MNQHLMRITSRLLIVTTLGFGVPLHSAHAGVVATDRVAISAESQSERDRIRSFLDREDVRKALQSQGIDASNAKARVDALTDDEVQRLAGKLDNMPAGGDIIGILFLVFIVLLITDIMGFTKVFSFTRPVR